MTGTDRDASQMRDSSQQSSDMVERVARALCELRIRTVRRHDTPCDRLEAMLPGAVDYAWCDFENEANTALKASHHAKLVETLKAAKIGIIDGSDPRTRNEHLADALTMIDHTLAKIGCAS